MSSNPQPVLIFVACAGVMLFVAVTLGFVAAWGRAGGSIASFLYRRAPWRRSAHEIADILNTQEGRSPVVVFLTTGQELSGFVYKVSDRFLWLSSAIVDQSNWYEISAIPWGSILHVKMMIFAKPQSK